MLIFKNLEDVQRQNLKNCRITIGRFQGVHRGHQHLISQLGPKDKSSPTVVITFDPPPEDVLFPQKRPQIMSLEQKLHMFKTLGVDIVFLIPFTQEIADLSPEHFAERFLFTAFNPSLIVVGYDFAFGKDRKGDFETLKMLKSPNVKLKQVEPLMNGEEIVSTSFIRKLLTNGDVFRVKEFLGRHYKISGRVVDGEKRGRVLGFPTANLQYENHRLLPKVGVYAVDVFFENQKMLGVCNIGFHPTFEQSSQIKVECHILDFDQDLYNKNIEIAFLERLRDERKFSSKDDLVRAIENDIHKTRSLVSGK